MTLNRPFKQTALALIVASSLASIVSFGTASPCAAGSLFSHLLPQGQARQAPNASRAAALAAEVNQALAERRYVDAGTLLDQSVAQDLNSTELTLLGGELLLARSHYADALAIFRDVAADPALKARALEGQGVALSLLGHSDEALADLKEATELDKTLWRAWNALGAEYDIRRDWPHAEAAYAKALAAPGVSTAVVLNNRGYSRLLQREPDKASADFVDALQNDPSLAQARTNLRMALAMQGHYARASMAGVGDDRAAVLNNVGVAALMRGDYISADRLLNEAIAAKGVFYARAAENLQISHQLATLKDETATEADAVP